MQAWVYQRKITFLLQVVTRTILFTASPGTIILIEYKPARDNW